jgi:Zn-finger nucleic acid-binding protein
VTNAAVGMPCPVCKVALVMSERQGVEIDYCPQCRGVWLDRGELDKILERSAQDAPAAAPPPAAPQPQAQPRGPAPFERAPEPYYGDDDGRHRQPYRGKRRKSFFEDLFD